jgi:crotonobetainyl-CoA:carnitine CoA-transferase CaiB-like acyl-CoA transferase
MQETTMKVFEGLKVLDVASFIAAPMAAAVLSDFGAQVIKVEPPGEGDGYRRVYRLANLPVCDHNYAWSLVARNKRALALDLKHAEGRAVLHRMVAGCDVLVTNYPPGVRARLGLDYAALRDLNPRLIYASLTGHGESGPEADKPGFDATTYWARSGLADLVRPAPESPPANVGNGMGDHQAAMVLFGAIVTALYRRERTGQGAMVSTSLLANGAWANAVQIQAAMCGGEVLYRQPRTQPRNALTNYYLCRDGRWFILSLLAEDRQWPVFARLVEAYELVDDPRFCSAAQRRANAAVLVPELDRAFARRDSADWQRCFEASGLTAGVVARTADVPHDAQMRECGALVRADGIPGGWTVDSPFQVSGEEKVRPGPAPTVGQHSDDVLSEHAFSAREIDALRKAGAVF